MTANRAVADGDTRKALNKLAGGRFADITRRIKEGTLPRDYTLDAVARALQEIVEGRIVLHDTLVFEPPLIRLRSVEEFNIGQHIRVGQKVGKRVITKVSPRFIEAFGDVVEHAVPVRMLPRWQARGMGWASGNALLSMLGTSITETALAHAVQVIEAFPRSPRHWSWLCFKCARGDEAPWTIRWEVDDTTVTWDAFPPADSEPRFTLGFIQVCGG